MVWLSFPPDFRFKFLFRKSIRLRNDPVNRLERSLKNYKGTVHRKEERRRTKRRKRNELQSMENQITSRAISLRWSRDNDDLVKTSQIPD